MLAFADVLAVIGAVVSVATVFNGNVETAFWAGVFTPIWLVLAKLHGLYDRDHRTLRHLTVDEAPSIFLWALTGTAATGLFLLLTPVGAVDIATAFRMGLVAALGAFVLRACARLLWRRITPRERTMIVGTGALADATRRKLELFPDIHVQLVANGHFNFNGGGGPLPNVDRIILASQSIEEDTI